MRIAITRVDGGVSIMAVVEGHPDEAIEKWKTVNPGGYVSHQEIDDVPADRTFREAWVATGKGVDIDMPKARDIKRDALRVERAPLLAALDLEISRAYKDPAKQDEIEAKRQALRDVTADPMIDAATTVDELKAVLPDALK